MNPIKRYLGYFLILLFLVTGAFGVTSWVKMKELQVKVESHELKQKELVEANATQALAIRTLKEVREADTVVLQALSKDLNDLADKDFRVNLKLSQLEKNDENVRALLAIVLPAGGCLLDDSCEAGSGKDGSGKGQATGKPAGEVPNAADRAIGDREGHGAK